MASFAKQLKADTETLLSRLLQRNILSSAHHSLYEIWFSLVHRANTRFWIQPEDLDFSEDAKKHSTAYGPSPYFYLSQAFDGTDFNCNGRVFIDFGCGAGRVMLFAARLPLRRIIGVELSPTLCRAAETNMERYHSRHKKSPDWAVVNADARSFAIPDGSDVFFFFNPFDETILAEVLDNIIKSVRQTPRDCVVVYMNPVHADVLVAKGLRMLPNRSKKFQYYSTFLLDAKSLA